MGQPPCKHTVSASHTSLFLCRPVCRPLPPDIARSRWPAAALLRADPPACDRPALPLADAQNTAAAVLMKSDEHVSDEPQSHRVLKHRCRCRAPPPPPSPPTEGVAGRGQDRVGRVAAGDKCLPAGGRAAAAASHVEAESSGGDPRPRPSQCCRLNTCFSVLCASRPRTAWAIAPPAGHARRQPDGTQPKR